MSISPICASSLRKLLVPFVLGFPGLGDDLSKAGVSLVSGALNEVVLYGDGSRTLEAHVWVCAALSHRAH